MRFAAAIPHLSLGIAQGGACTKMQPLAKTLVPGSPWLAAAAIPHLSLGIAQGGACTKMQPLAKTLVPGSPWLVFLLPSPYTSMKQPAVVRFLASRPREMSEGAASASLCSLWWDVVEGAGRWRASEMMKERSCLLSCCLCLLFCAPKNGQPLPLLTVWMTPRRQR